MTDDPRKNVPAAQPGTGLAKAGAGKKGGAFLAAVRASKAVAPAGAVRTGGADPALIAAALAPKERRPRLVFAIDATASREPAWQAARSTTDALFDALPGQLDVALAVHGGSELHTFTAFTSQPAQLRDTAARIACRAGGTQLVEVLARSRDAGDVRVVVYIGDVFEENADEAAAVADTLRLRGCRVVILHDRGQVPAYDPSVEVFQDIARRTGGAVLPFDARSKGKLREILEAVATLAVGGVKLLQERRKVLPSAALLLQHLSGKGDVTA